MCEDIIQFESTKLNQNNRIIEETRISNFIFYDLKIMLINNDSINYYLL